MTLSLILMLSPNAIFLGFAVCWLQANQSSSGEIREQKQRYYAFTQSPNNSIIQEKFIVRTTVLCTMLSRISKLFFSQLYSYRTFQSRTPFAIDRDLDKNAKISYSINEAGSSRFSANSKTGALYTRADLGKNFFGFKAKIFSDF